MAAHVEFEHPRIACWKYVTDDYYINSLLGKGKWGTVREGTPKFSEQSVAIKSTDNEDVRSFINEVDLMSRFNHPYITKIRDLYTSTISQAGISKVHTDLVMNKGVSLDKLLDVHPDLELHLREEICFKLISGLTYLEKHGYIYTDIKVHNVLFFSNPTHIDIKLADFGGYTLTSYQMQTTTRTYADLRSYFFRGFRVYKDPLSMSQGTRTFKSKPNISSLNMWGLAITLMWILTGEQVYKTPRLIMIGKLPLSFYEMWDDPEKWIRNPERKIAQLRKWHPLLLKLIGPPDKRPKTYREVLNDSIFDDLAKRIGQPQGDVYHHKVPDRYNYSLPRVEQSIIKFRNDPSLEYPNKVVSYALEYIVRYLLPVFLDLNSNSSETMVNTMLEKRVDIDIRSFVLCCFMLAEGLMGLSTPFAAYNITVGTEMLNSALFYLCKMIRVTKGTVRIHHSYFDPGFSLGEHKSVDSLFGITDGSFTFPKYSNKMKEFERETEKIRDQT